MKKATKILAGILCFGMFASAVPMTSLADVANYNKDFQSETHTVFKHTEQTLAPGVTQYTNYAYTTSDEKQMVYYVTTADVNRDDVMMQVSYKGMQHDQLGMEKLADTVKVANAKYSNPADKDFISEYYTVVSATNGNGYNMTTGKPSGVWAMGGEIITDYVGGTNMAYLAIDGNGKAVMGRTVAEWNALKAGAGVKEAINCFGTYLVWDGKATNKSMSERASRTMVGITADGQIVCCVVDGRQEPFSCGATYYELANIMLEAGCVCAMNLDGGGSTTYMAKNEGSNECTVNNRPSDGSERAISNGIIIASLAAPSNVFDHAAISVSNNYVMPNASVNMTVTGVSPAGTAAEIPEGVTYTADLGTIKDGVYTAGSTTGVDTIKAMLDGKVVGTCEVNVVAPTKIAFSAASIACPYGKTTDLTVVPTYGDFDLEVAYNNDAVSFTLGDNSFGTVENGKFTATSKTLEKTKSTITVATKCTPSVSATVDLQVGRGSEVIWDFEDNDVSKFSYFDYYNSKSQLDISTVDATTGKVHNGKSALALHYDYSQTTYYEDYLSLIVEYNAAALKAHGASNKDSQGGTIGGLEEDYISIKGACGMGFWLYLPDEIDIYGFNPRLMFGFKKNPTDKWSRGTTSMKLIVDVQHLPTDGWYYYWADLSAYSSYAGLTVQNARPLNENGSSKNGYGGYAAGNYYAGSILDFYVEESAWKAYNRKSYNSNFTLYIDDWTVDYSTVVEDNQAPEFGSALYACNGMFDAATLTDGQNINANEIDFTIEVADANRFLPAGSTAYKTTTNAVGINASTAKVMIDGVEVASSYKNGKLALAKAIDLPDGAHKVTFQIADNNGNVGRKTYKFNVGAGTSFDTIKVVPHNTDLKEVLAGSLYYIDLVATDIANVNKVTTTLKVNNVNNWEQAGITVADGFEVTSATEPGDAGELYLTIERKGDVTATGEAVIASVPVRAWYPHNVLGKDSAWLIANNRIFPMDIKVEVKAGAIEFVNAQDYLGAFSANQIQIDNESMCAPGKIGVIIGKESGTGKTTLHNHKATAVADKKATCTEDGFTGRTYCADCDSIVDFGTVVPATGHNFDFVEGVLKCVNCGMLFNGEYTDGKTYVDGVAANGWIGDSYFEDGAKLTGIHEIDGAYYDFGTDGVCPNRIKFTGLFFDEENGVYRYSTLGALTSGWVVIDGNYHYFRKSTMCAIAGKFTPNRATFECDETGKILSGVWFTNEEGTFYYYGPSFYRAANKATIVFETIDGVTYGFDKAGHMITGVIVARISNGVNTAYEFAPNGSFIGNYTGFHEGKHYVDGLVKTGLVKEGDDYYYILSTGIPYVGTVSVTAEKTNGIYAPGKYTFGEDGKMIMLNGFHNGFYYENNVIMYGKGLVKIDGDFYYVGMNGKAYVGTVSVTEAKANGLYAPGKYTFGEDGKMVMLNGFHNGFYYENNVIMYGKGLVKIDGDYYYINMSGKAFVGSVGITAEKTNGLMAPGKYTFGVDGKMVILNGFKNGFYYENNVIMYGKGTVKVEGDIYYINKSGKAYVGMVSITAEKANGILTPGKYEFGADGKLVLDK